MTSQQSRESFLEGLLHGDELEIVREMGLYEDYVEGRVSITDIYRQMRDQGQ